MELLLKIDPASLAPLYREMKIMTEALDRLRADVAAESSLVDSAVTLITGLAAQIRDAVSTGDDDALNALADDIEAKSSALAAAVSAGTVAPAAAPVSPVDATTPVKVLAAVGDEGAPVVNSTGAGAFDPPAPDAVNPFTGEAPAVAQPTGETATNVAEEPSQSTLDAGLADATSGTVAPVTATPIAPAGDTTEAPGGATAA